MLKRTENDKNLFYQISTPEIESFVKNHLIEAYIDEHFKRGTLPLYNRKKLWPLIEKSLCYILYNLGKRQYEEKESHRNVIIPLSKSHYKKIGLSFLGTEWAMYLLIVHRIVTAVKGEQWYYKEDKDGNKVLQMSGQMTTLVLNPVSKWRDLHNFDSSNLVTLLNAQSMLTVSDSEKYKPVKYRKDKVDIGYAYNTEEAEEVKKIFKAFKAHGLNLKPTRIFGEDEDSYGRIYGCFPYGMKKEVREELLKANGYVSCDFKASQPNLLYMIETGKPYDKSYNNYNTNDPYTVLAAKIMELCVGDLIDYVHSLGECRLINIHRIPKYELREHYTNDDIRDDEYFESGMILFEKYSEVYRGVAKAIIQRALNAPNELSASRSIREYLSKEVGLYGKLPNNLEKAIQIELNNLKVPNKAQESNIRMKYTKKYFEDNHKRFSAYIYKEYDIKYYNAHKFFFKKFVPEDTNCPFIPITPEWAIETIKETFPEISQHFFKKETSDLCQNLDSNIALGIMKTMIQMDLAPLSLHDEFIVPKKYEKKIRRVMWYERENQIALYLKKISSLKKDKSYKVHSLSPFSSYINSFSEYIQLYYNLLYYVIFIQLHNLYFSSLTLLRRGNCVGIPVLYSTPQCNSPPVI